MLSVHYAHKVFAVLPERCWRVLAKALDGSFKLSLLGSSKLSLSYLV
uniref:Uncharacterized protein n=1 Tax=Setaria viridis TaxID=4556 RepID=A0A4U6VFW5_SETVI|nr:hypothetical protein SEVIR_3G324600v2 [Setaria viridis]TKW28461.1 hypothetical protein SEVIR_3G324600v2 [Setaria viridis]TKW28462.1 hypothetical protein SEVIR_3G324600v2 [Setaria viridis]